MLVFGHWRLQLKGKIETRATANLPYHADVAAH